MKTMICNASIVTMNSNRELLKNAGMLIIDGTIERIGSSSEMVSRYRSEANCIDARGKVVFPGMINTHVHSYQSLMKGLGDDRVFSDWLREITVPFGNALDPEACAAGAELCAMESIHSGVTTIVDMHQCIDKDCVDAMINTYDDLKLRTFFAIGYMHDTMADDLQLRQLRANLTLLLERPQSERINYMLSPFQVWNNDSYALSLTQEMTAHYHVPVITHALETPYDHATCIQVHGLTELQTLKKYDLLNSDTILIHGVQISEEEMSVVSQSGASLCYSPVCNMYLASGFAPVGAMNRMHMNIVLGTEGAGCNNSCDMIETLKFAALTQKALYKDAKIISAEDVFAMCTVNAAKALGIKEKIGSLEEGKIADLFIFDPKRSPKATPSYDPLSTLVYSSSPENIDTVMVGGEIVMRDGKIPEVDERARLAAAQCQGDRIRKKAKIALPAKYSSSFTS